MYAAPIRLQPTRSPHIEPPSRPPTPPTLHPSSPTLALPSLLPPPPLPPLCSQADGTRKHLIDAILKLAKERFYEAETTSMTSCGTEVIVVILEYMDQHQKCKRSGGLPLTTLCSLRASPALARPRHSPLAFAVNEKASRVSTLSFDDSDSEDSDDEAGDEAGDAAGGRAADERTQAPPSPYSSLEQSGKTRLGECALSRVACRAASRVACRAASRVACRAASSVASCALPLPLGAAHLGASLLINRHPHPPHPAQLPLSVELLKQDNSIYKYAEQLCKEARKKLTASVADLCMTYVLGGKELDSKVRHR